MLSEFLYKLDIILPAIAFIISGIVMVRRKDRFFSDHILLLFFALQLVLNSVCAYRQAYRINNQLPYHINCLLTQFIFTYNFAKTLKQKRLIVSGLLLFLISYLFLSAGVQPFLTFPSYAYGLGSGIISAYSLLLLFNLIDNLPVTNILELKEFWIIAGVLTYFGSSFIIFISYDYLSGIIQAKQVSLLWQFHNIFLSFGCILFLKAIYAKQWILK